MTQELINQILANHHVLMLMLVIMLTVEQEAEMVLLTNNHVQLVHGRTKPVKANVFLQNPDIILLELQQ